MQQLITNAAATLLRLYMENNFFSYDSNTDTASSPAFPTVRFHKAGDEVNVVALHTDMDD